MPIKNQTPSLERQNMNISMIFKTPIRLGFALMLAFTAAMGVIGLRQLSVLSRQMAVREQVGICLERFNQVREWDRKFLLVPCAAEDSRNLAAGNWNLAKDKFLSEVRKLSQTSSLNEMEKRLIRSIQEAWKGYDASFHKYILAANGPINQQPAAWEATVRDPLIRRIETAAAEVIGREKSRTGLQGLFAESRSVEQAALRQTRILWLGLTVGLLLAGVILGRPAAQRIGAEPGLTPEQIAAAHREIRQLTESIAAASRDPGCEDWPPTSPDDVEEEAGRRHRPGNP